jgi:SiaC family regulatory phosphoprotein
MENLTLEGSAKTPTINFDATSGKLELRGRSIPENSVEFYKPLNEWIENYGTSPAGETSVDVKLEYFNTSSSKCILDLFKKLEAIAGSKTNVTVNWFFEEDDEDMEEAGQDYKAIIGLPFNIIEVEEI